MSEQPLTPPVVTGERPQLIDKSVKAMRMRKNLAEIQGKLHPIEKAFSKAVHQPLVSLLSDLVSKTIARPSGLLGGGLVAFVGSTAYLWLIRPYDLAYNSTFFLLFFVSGYLLGLVGEVLVTLLRKTRGQL